VTFRFAISGVGEAFMRSADEDDWQYRTNTPGRAFVKPAPTAPDGLKSL